MSDDSKVWIVNKAPSLLSKTEIISMVLDEIQLEAHHCLSLDNMTKNDLWALLQAVRRTKGK